MDYLGEAIFLSIDSIIFGLCLRSYLENKRALQAVKTAPEYQIDNRLEDFLEKNNGFLPYIAIRGNVKALGPSIRSINQPSITGVVQKLIIKEHIVARSSSGFWTENERTINEVFNAIPFALANKKSKLEFEVVDALAAEILDMEVIADRYDPSNLSLMDHLWGFFTGIRKRGLQTIEEVLKDGAFVTGVGEVRSENGLFKLQPPSNGTPFFITTMPLTALVRRIEEKVTHTGWFSVGFGVIGLVISGLAVSKYMRKRREWLKKEEEKKRLDSTRKERRKRVRNVDDISEDKLCVVCQTNPKEVILLPCGHVCLCEDCSDKIKEECPVCKSIIISRNPAYIA